MSNCLLKASFQLTNLRHSNTAAFIAGSAVVRGAVPCGVVKDWISMVSSRKAAWTIGYDTTRPFVKGKHSDEYKVVDRSDPKRSTHCDNIFGMIVRIGDEVPSNYVQKVTLRPIYREGKEDGDEIELNIFKTRARNPPYVTSTGVKELAKCFIKVPSKAILGRQAKLQLSVHFGTMLRATVEGKNFAGEIVKLPAIKMKYTCPD